MSKIKLTYKENQYILEFTRNTAKAIELQGFVLEELTNKPNTMIPLLIRGAFMKNHSQLKQERVEEIWSAQSKKADLMTALAEMYVETFSSLMESNEGEEEKNATWEIL